MWGQVGKGQLRRDDHANEHADHAPDDRHDGELLDDLVVIFTRCGDGHDEIPLKLDL